LLLILTPPLLVAVVNQFYDAEITKEYVMRGNSAIIKCLIPSFVADFVHVVAWIDDDGEEILSDGDYSGGKALMIKLHDPEMSLNPLSVTLNCFPSVPRQL